MLGSVLLPRANRGNPDAEPFIRLGGNMSALAGFIISYPEWSQRDAPPVPYPPSVLGDGGIENAAVIDCCFLGTYEAIRLVSAHRHLIRNVYGYPHWRGIYVDMCGDVGRIENCHFWPFGVDYKPDDPFCEWVNTHAVAFEFARTDWQYVLNTFCFGYGVGYKFSESRNGACNGNFLGIGADSCERAVLVEQAQPFGLLMTNGEFVGRWGSKNAVCIEVQEKAETKVSLTNCAFWGPIDRCIVQKSPDTQLTANACHFVNWDKTAIELSAGKATIQGCTFVERKTCVEVAEAVKSAILLGNQATAGFIVENNAGARTQSGFNEEPSV
jgi:hypothetical protein